MLRPKTRRDELERSLRAHLRLLVGAAALSLLAALYTADLLSAPGTVSRGVVVAGVPIGGLRTADAQAALRKALEARAASPVAVVAQDFRGELDPVAAGLSIDWAATVGAASVRPLNPVTRLTSLFAEREVDVISDVDGVRLDAALHRLRPAVERPPAEGAVRFEGLVPVPVDPVSGRSLDASESAQALRNEWWKGRPVPLAVAEIPPITTAGDLRHAIDTIVAPAVAEPVTVTGDGVQATLTREVLAAALGLRVDPSVGGRFVPEMNLAVLTGAARPGLTPSERPARDAMVVNSSGTTEVVPSQEGRTVDYAATFARLPEVLALGGAARVVPAIYAVQVPKLTTEQARSSLPPDEMSAFTTGGFAADSGRNIRRAAEAINGKVVEPGQTFSLNAATNPRDASNGYVEAGIIEEGQPARGIGGGVSQVATTLYNAAYFAGMTDVEHKEHSYYIGRYPVAREATVFNDLIDVKFRNDGPGRVTIRTEWTPRSLTVRLLGTKIYQVSSVTGPRTGVTPPPVRTVSGKDCKASRGSAGFTATDTRTLRDLRTGQTRSETRTVTYNPSPTIRCKK